MLSASLMNGVEWEDPHVRLRGCRHHSSVLTPLSSVRWPLAKNRKAAHMCMCVCMCSGWKAVH